MSETPLNSGHDLRVPRLRFGLCMAGAVAAGLAATVISVFLFHGTGAIVAAACTALGLASLISFAPALFAIGPEHWGLTVMLCGVTRSLGVLAISYGLSHANPGLASRPLYMGVAAGAIVILVCESVLAISTLSELERRRVRLKGAATAGPHTNTP